MPISNPCPGCPNQPEISEPEISESGIPNVSMPKKPVPGWVLYNGGPPEAHLAMMQYTLPDDYTYGHFLADGSILYDKKPDDWEPPGLVEGYERDGQDSWSFHPLWKSCQLRIYGTEIKEQCNCIQVLTMCNHPEITLDNHGEVTFGQCNSCLIRIPIPIPFVPKRTEIPTPFKPRSPVTGQS